MAALRRAILSKASRKPCLSVGHREELYEWYFRSLCCVNILHEHLRVPGLVALFMRHYETSHDQLSHSAPGRVVCPSEWMRLCDELSLDARAVMH
jgi:hypothetical protein